VNDFGKFLLDQQFNVAPGRFVRLQNLTAAELTERKKELSKQLKWYDKAFATKFGRKPFEFECGLIRYLYDVNSMLKNCIRQTAKRQGGQEEVRHGKAKKFRPPKRPPFVVDLESLKSEKQLLHREIMIYEREFFNTSDRKVSSEEDRLPIKKTYSRYFEIKRIMKAHETGKNGLIEFH